MNVRSIGIVISASLWLAACGSQQSDEESVTVGFAQPVTGALATQGVTFEEAIRLAQKQINDHGGIRGKELRLVEEDTQTDADAAKQVATDFMAQGVTSVITADGSASVFAMLDVTVPAGAVMVVGTAQAVELARPENHGLFFRPGSTALDEAGRLASAVAADGYTKVAVISNTHPYTSSFDGEFEKAFAASSCSAGPCEITVHNTYPVSVDAKTFDFGPLVDEALASDAEAIVFASYPPDANALFDAAWAAGYRGPLYTTAAAGNENLTPFLTQEQADAVKWASLDPPVGPSADFVRDLWTKSGLRAEDFVGPVHTNYDAMFVLGLALAHADSMDGETIAESMRAVADPPGTKIYAGEWAKGLAAIEAGEDIDYVGVASAVDFDDLGNIEIGTAIKGYRDGEAVVLED